MGSDFNRLYREYFNRRRKIKPDFIETAMLYDSITNSDEAFKLAHRLYGIDYARKNRDANYDHFHASAETIRESINQIEKKFPGATERKGVER